MILVSLLPGHICLTDFLSVAAVHSQSETVRDVGGCVWTHYLTVTDRAGGAGGGGGAALTAAQQQELWVQYTALQTALQVRKLRVWFLFLNHCHQTNIMCFHPCPSRRTS